MTPLLVMMKNSNITVLWGLKRTSQRLGPKKLPEMTLIKVFLNPKYN